jgi:beta-phosphoglucomutase
MDGVLVDSYRPHLESWQLTAREYHLAMTEPQFARYFGYTSREIIHAVWGDRFPEDQIPQFDRRKEAVYRELIQKEIPAVPGLHDLLKSLAADGAKMAVGSSGPIENINLVLDHLGIRNYFSGLVSAHDVTAGKPNPEVFLKAAEKMNLSPACCVVIEDAPPGIQAAHAAGMKCIGLLTSHPSERVSAADFITENLTGVDTEEVHKLLTV